MAIDMASVYAARYRKQPDMLRAAVMGQSPDPKLDSYTALNALRLVKEADMMDMAGKAQQPTSSPSMVAENMAPNPMMQGLGAMVPGAMGQAPQGMPQQGMPRSMPQPTMQAASGGLASLPTADEDYAAGGIVAFQAGGETEEDYQRETSDTGYSDSQGRRTDAEGNLLEDADTDTGTGSATNQFNAILLKQLASMQKRRVKTTSPEDIKRLRAEFLAREVKNAGPDIYEPEIARGAQEEADRGKRRNTGEAMALLTAAGAVLKGRNLSEGASNALPAYAGAMGEVDRADQAMKSANAKMQFALKDAQRKERAGNNRAADAAMENYRKFEQDQNKAEFDKENAIANLAAKGVTGNRATGKGAGAGGLKWQEQLYADNVANLMATSKPKQGESQEAFTARVRAEAGKLTANQAKTSFSTGEIGAVNAETRLAPTIRAIDADVIAKLGDFKESDRAYRAAVRKKDTNEASRLLTLEETRLRNLYQTPAAAPAKSTAPAAAAKPTATSKVVSMADVNATVASSGRTKQEVIDALNAKGYTVK